MFMQVMVQANIYLEPMSSTEIIASCRKELFDGQEDEEVWFYAGVGAGVGAGVEFVGVVFVDVEFVELVEAEALHFPAFRL